MELFMATGKLKVFFYNWRSSMCAPRVTRLTSIRYSRSCHTRINMDASIFITAAKILAVRSARSCVMVGRTVYVRANLVRNYAYRLLFSCNFRVVPQLNAIRNT
jgi:hypothetical protein